MRALIIDHYLSQTTYLLETEGSCPRNSIYKGNAFETLRKAVESKPGQQNSFTCFREIANLRKTIIEIRNKQRNDPCFDLMYHIYGSM